MGEDYEKHLAEIWVSWGRPGPEKVGDLELQRADQEASEAVRHGVRPRRDFRASARGFIKRVIENRKQRTRDLSGALGDLGSILVETPVRMILTLFGGGLMKFFDMFVNLFPAALRDYIPTVLAAVVVLLNLGLQALGVGFDVWAVLEVIVPSGMAGQVIVMRQRLKDKGSGGSKTITISVAVLAVIGVSLGVSIWNPALVPVVAQISGALLAALGLGATAAATAGAVKVPAKKKAA